MLRRLVPLLLLLFTATPALAGQDETYSGVVGSAPIVMELTPGTDEVTGQYFYRSTRFDIDLSGQWRGQALELTSSLTGDHLSLTRAGGGLAGALTTAKGRRLAVSLQPAGEPSPPPAPADLPPKLSLYARLQLSGLTLIPQGPETLNGKTIRWYRNGLTGIRLFRLESGYAAPAMAAMNQALARNQWAEVSAWLQCPGSGGGPGMDSSEADRPWLGPAHVSYIWRSSWSCAGTAHPDFGADGHSFDARTGRELTLDEVLPENGGRPIPPADSDAWLDYRSKVFAPAVVALLKRHHQAEMTPPKSGDDDDCDYADPDVWDFPSWALTDKGLWLGAVFARVMRPCDSPDWAVIPWSALPSQGRAAR